MLVLLVFIVNLITTKTKENLLLLMCCCCYYYNPFLTFMQCIYNYIPETNHVFRVYSVAAAPYLQFIIYIYIYIHTVILPLKYVLYFYISTFCNMCAVPNMAVFLYLLKFILSLISHFPGMLLSYYYCKNN